MAGWVFAVSLWAAFMMAGCATDSSVKDKRIPSHFTTIGMRAETAQEARSLLQKAAANGVRVQFDRGYYIIWSSATGAQLWLVITKENQLDGATPFFDGESEFSVGITSKVTRRDADELAGALYGWANPPGDDPSTGDYPLIFDALNVEELQDFTLPCIRRVKIAAFAHEISIYADEDEFSSAQDSKIRFASRSFIPVGTFDPKGQPTAMLTGRILKFRRLQNELTGGDFIWIKVDTLGGTLDVVVSPELVTRDLRQDGIISGFFYLSGKIER